MALMALLWAQIVVLKPPETLLGERLTRKHVVAIRLDPAIGSISNYPIPVGRAPAQRAGPATLRLRFQQ